MVPMPTHMAMRWALYVLMALAIIRVAAVWVGAAAVARVVPQQCTRLFNGVDVVVAPANTIDAGVLANASHHWHACIHHRC